MIYRGAVADGLGKWAVILTIFARTDLKRGPVYFTTLKPRGNTAATAGHPQKRSVFAPPDFAVTV